MVDEFSRRYQFVGKFEENTVQTNDEDAAEFEKWLLNWGDKSNNIKKETENSDKLYKRDDYYPIVLL